MNCEGEDNNGHAIEGDTNGQGLFEGCVFKDVKQTVVDDFKGHLFSVGSTSVSDHGHKMFPPLKPYSRSAFSFQSFTDCRR